MNRSIHSLTAMLRRFARNRRGATAIIVALTSTVMIGFAGFSVDMGHIMYIQRKMQASSDAAALAGAMQLSSTTSGAAVSTANSYSAVTGGLNQITEVPVTMVSGFPKTECLATLTAEGLPCTGSADANALQVKEQANVPTWFAQIFGVTTIPISVISTAAAHGGGTGSSSGGANFVGQDVIVVLDSTASMGDSDSSCSLSSPTRESCSQAFLRNMLLALSPSATEVAVWTFPGLVSSSDASLEYTCGEHPTSSDLTSYKSPVYQIVSFDTTYKAAGATTLNTSDNLVKSVSGGASGCNSGIDAIGGYGTYYAGIITAATAALTGDGNPTHQKVLVIVSDGGSNASSSNVPTGMAANQCQEAITAAKAATTAGVIVYSVAYGSETATGSGSTCTTDTSGTLSGLSSCTTMQDMASAPQYFYADGSGGSGTCASVNSVGGSGESSSDIATLGSTIGGALSRPHLIPDNTT